jgi:hypothetical protein
MNDSTPMAFPPSPENEQLPMSLTARMFNILAAPGEVFESVRNAGVSTASWLTPAVVFLLVSWLGAVVILSQDSIQQQVRDITAMGLDAQVQKGTKTREQAESERPMAEKVVRTVTISTSIIIPLMMAFGTPFFGGLIVWLAGNKLWKADFSYMKAVEIAGLAATVNILGEIVRILLVIMQGNMMAVPSPAILFKDLNPQSGTYAVLSALNVFVLWHLVVRSIGLAKLSNVSFAKAAVIVFGVWIAITGFFLGLGQLGRMAGGG